ncbi:alpha-hydroxy acid oxidase [Pseudokineococcus basanitobsidens]|uniref:Alpha-hydroxy acid oxidase n=1 Tax=Pseudokineococcus basanitobsidens TaxID=1926649 RepID=A0ABU8RFN6_9ACTN
MSWVDDLEHRARVGLPAYVAGYVAAAAGGGECLAEELAGWEALRFRPRVLTDTGDVDLTTTVLGTPVRTPVLVAPMAQQVAAHPDGEAATGRAAAAAGSLLGVSTNTAVPFADVAATGAPWWYQVYVMADRGLTRLLVERAAAAGARALVLTLDTTALATDAPGGQGVEPTDWPPGPARARATALTSEDLADRDQGATAMARDLDADVVGWLAEVSGLPVLVKGVLRGDDAVRCLDAGAAGVVVSTHGGRRLGSSVTALRALPEVVAALDGRAEVLVDSGIRSGAHVAAALALGARAAFVGRPAWWGLAADGEAGVRSVLDRLTAELALVLRQVGAPSVRALAPDLLDPATLPARPR